jgi:Ribosomal S13/S15 N-terminal domain
MHTPGKGIASSALPYSRRAPSWLKTSPSEVVEQIHKLARRGMTPSQIGVVLRDSHGVAQVRFVTGNKILRILKAGGLAPEIPEDLYHLIKKVIPPGPPPDLSPQAGSLEIPLFGFLPLLHGLMEGGCGEKASREKSQG